MLTSLMKVAAIATALISSASPAAPLKFAGVHSRHQTVSPKKAPTPPRLNCDDHSKKSFNSYRQYSCGYLAFHNNSSVFVDPVKLKAFEKLWNPAPLAHSPELKMAGVSDKSRKALTFSLLKRMRDFAHERFDYVEDQEEVADEEKSEIHPVIHGGIGADLKLENAWMIDQGRSLRRFH